MFCVAELARYVVVQDEHLSPMVFLLGAVPPLAAIAFSAAIWRTSARRALSVRTLYASVVVDWALCLAGLLQNVLWPWETYPGITAVPDIGLVYLIVFASVFRLSAGASVLSGLLNLGSCVLLFRLDYAFALAGQAWNLNALSLVLLACVAVTGITVTMAWWTRRLVLRGAVESWRITRARRTLDALMEESHGIRSLLGAAKLDADRIARLAEAGDGERALGLAGDLQRELAELVRLTSQSRLRSFSALAELRPVERGRLPEIAEGVAHAVGARFPGVKLELTGTVSSGRIGVVGGDVAVERILLNLMTNACEGHGTQSARNVRTRFEERGAALLVHVVDDGPGFPASLLRGPVECTTTKPNGTGIGLFLVHRLMAESGGEIALANGARGGAEVTLSFREYRETPEPSAGP